MKTDPIQPLDDGQSGPRVNRECSSIPPVRSFGWVGSGKKHSSAHRQICIVYKGFSFFWSQWDLAHPPGVE